MARIKNDEPARSMESLLWVEQTDVEAVKASEALCLRSENRRLEVV